MENKLTIKHLSCYLPYGLKFRQRVRKATLPPTFYYKSRLMTTKNIDWLTKSEIQKPILRPLSDIEDLALKGYLMTRGYECALRGSEWDELFSSHFDVFGLIKKGLAIDINKIKE